MIISILLCFFGGQGYYSILNKFWLLTSQA